MTEVESFVPSDRAMRRALLRTDDGVTLNALEAETLLHARREDLQKLLAAASRIRDVGLEKAGKSRSDHLFAQGLHPALAPVPGPLPLLHLRHHAGEPGQGWQGPFLSPDDVLDIARAGAALGCKEALFTLGDRPEDRWPVAGKWLDAHGYDSPIDYLRAMAIRVLEETGLLPHLNPG